MDREAYLARVKARLLAARGGAAPVVEQIEGAAVFPIAPSSSPVEVPAVEEPDEEPDVLDEAAQGNVEPAQGAGMIDAFHDRVQLRHDLDDAAKTLSAESLAVLVMLARHLARVDQAA
jgi:hypothetical protein